MDRTLITRHKGDYLLGSFFQAGADGFVATVDPSTGVALDRVPFRVAAVSEAVGQARAATDAWGTAPVGRRIEILRKLRDVLDGRRNGIAAMISRESGKALWEAQLECVAAVRAADLMLAQGAAILADSPHPSAQGSLRRRPLGVVGAVTPFPYPIYVPIQLLLPVLLAGNAVVWKPSSLVPLSSQVLAEAFDSARIPAGVLSMVQGPADPIGKALGAHPGLDMLVAAGSAETARALRASPGRRRLWAQAGGKGWAIVCADADLDRAAYEVVTSAFLTGGQRCNATSRVLVERKVAGPFLERLVALTGTLKVGAPTDPESFCGPLVGAHAREAFEAVLAAWVAAGVEFPVEGGSARLPGPLKRRGQAYAAPAVALVDDELPATIPPPEEVEGPLLVARVVGEAEEAAALFNRHPYGLAASVFTENQARFQGLARRIRAGAVNWNRGTIVASARYPNAGLRRSGYGAEGNAELIRQSTWPQATLAAAGRFNPSHRVPGLGWPEQMGTIDPSSVVTPPYRPDDDTEILPLDALPGGRKA